MTQWNNSHLLKCLFFPALLANGGSYGGVTGDVEKCCNQHPFLYASSSKKPDKPSSLCQPCNKMISRHTSSSYVEQAIDDIRSSLGAITQTENIVERNEEGDEEYSSVEDQCFSNQVKHFYGFYCFTLLLLGILNENRISVLETKSSSTNEIRIYLFCHFRQSSRQVSSLLGIWCSYYVTTLENVNIWDGKGVWGVGFKHLNWRNAYMQKQKAYMSQIHWFYFCVLLSFPVTAFAAAEHQEIATVFSARAPFCCRGYCLCNR